MLVFTRYTTNIFTSFSLGLVGSAHPSGLFLPKRLAKSDHTKNALFMEHNAASSRFELLLNVCYVSMCTVFCSCSLRSAVFNDHSLKSFLKLRGKLNSLSERDSPYRPSLRHLQISTTSCTFRPQYTRIKKHVSLYYQQQYYNIILSNIKQYNGKVSILLVHRDIIVHYP